MARTLLDLKQEADRRRDAGKAYDALKVYRLVVEAMPLDFDLRLEIGDVVESMGAKDIAGKIFQTVLNHDVRSGSPLRAMAALKRLEDLGGEVRPAIDNLSRTYAKSSDKLGRGLRPAPADYSAEVREDIDLDYFMDKNELIVETARLAAYVDNIENYPKVVPPVQIFSTLEHEGFTALLSRLKLKRFAPNEAIIEQGVVGNEVFFIARGEVAVVKTEEDDDEQVFLARLGPGTLFGEMALVGTEPRSASVVAQTHVDVLELTRSDVEELAFQIPQVAGAMARFNRERMIGNLIATNPLFKPFDEESSKQLLARFTGHEVPSGTIFLEQGKTGEGLYLILQGHAEVIRKENDETIKVADIGPGDIVGEISLLFEEPISATVRTTSKTTLLFLARELFTPLVDAVPDLMAHFNKLAEDRLADTEFKMMQSNVVDDDFVEDIEDGVDLCDDGIIFI
jgi:CRP-like cAMP-binding protein